MSTPSIPCDDSYAVLLRKLTSRAHVGRSMYCRAKVTYPNGDAYDGAFNDAKQKHGKGTYTWSSNTGSNPWVPEEGFPGKPVPLRKHVHLPMVDA